MAEQDPGHEATDGSAARRPQEPQLRGVVLDSGALDDLLDERVRAALVIAARTENVRLVVPLTVMTEFLLGHPEDLVRADLVLGVVEQVEATPRLARRAAWLLARATPGLKRTPSVTDGMIAAFGEIYGAVATNDTADLRALAAADTGFDIYVISDLMDALHPKTRDRDSG